MRGFHKAQTLNKWSLNLNNSTKPRVDVSRQWIFHMNARLGMCIDIQISPPFMQRAFGSPTHAFFHYGQPYYVPCRRKFVMPNQIKPSKF